MKKGNPVLSFLMDNGMYFVMLALFVYFAVDAQGFLTPNNLANIPKQTSFVILIATGMTLVIITGGIDLSVGSIVALVAVIFALFVEKSGLAIPLAIIAALALGCVAGGASGFFVVRFNVPPFIATLAMMVSARGLARYLASNTKIFIGGEQIWKYSEAIMIRKVGGVPLVVIFMLVVVVIFGLLLMKTRFGRYVIATGGNEEAAKLSGVNVGMVKLLVYVFNGGLASIVGIMMACQYTNGNPEFGVMWELDAIAACVVGGTSLMGGKGNIFKVLLGALLIGMLNNGLQIKGLSSEMIYMIKGAIILGAVIIDQLNPR